jgi:hypothetical protein
VAPANQGGFDLDAKGVFSNVLVAVGHPGLAVPAELEGNPRVVHAYEPHEYAAEVAVVGAWMAAATEWLNALAAGSSVVSVRRREPERRPLNLARTMFTAARRVPRGVTRERAALLRRFSPLSTGTGLGRAARAGHARGSLSGRERRRRREAVDLPPASGRASRRARSSCPREEHGLDTIDGWIVLDPDSTVTQLTDAGRTLALAGAHGQWAFPAADTLAGARYVAHRFVRRVKQWRTR